MSNEYLFYILLWRSSFISSQYSTYTYRTKHGVFILASGFLVFMVVALESENGIDGVVLGRWHGRGRVCHHRPVMVRRAVECQSERRDSGLVSPDEQLDVGPAVGWHLRGGRHHFTVAVAIRLHVDDDDGDDNDSRTLTGVYLKRRRGETDVGLYIVIARVIYIFAIYIAYLFFGRCSTCSEN